MILLTLLSIIVQLLHRLALCSHSCKFCDCAIYVDSCLIECWAVTFLFALIIGVDFIIAMDTGPLPPSPHMCVFPKYFHSSQKVILPRDRKILSAYETLYTNSNHSSSLTYPALFTSSKALCVCPIFFE